MSDPLSERPRGGAGNQPPAGLEKHLEMLQAVITRMAGNSFAAKGWSVGAATALVAFATQAKNPLLTLVALLPVLAFWGIDAYFLGLERRYRKLYDAVRIEGIGVDGGEKGPVPRYLLNPYWLDGAPGKPRSAFWTASVCAVHGSVLLAVLAVTAVLAITGPEKPEASPVSVKDTVTVRLLSAPPAGARARDTIPGSRPAAPSATK